MADPCAYSSTLESPFSEILTSKPCAIISSSLETYATFFTNKSSIWVLNFFVAFSFSNLVCFFIPSSIAAVVSPKTVSSRFSSTLSSVIWSTCASSSSSLTSLARASSPSSSLSSSTWASSTSSSLNSPLFTLGTCFKIWLLRSLISRSFFRVRLFCFTLRSFFSLATRSFSMASCSLTSLAYCSLSSLVRKQPLHRPPQTFDLN